MKQTLMEKEINKKYTGLYFRHSKRDWQTFLISAPIPVFLYNYFGFGNIYFSSITKFLLLTLIAFVQAFLIHYLLGHLCFFWRRQFPAIHQSIKRYVISLASYIVVTFSIISFFLWLYSKYNFLGFVFSSRFFFIAFGITVFSNIIMGSVYEFYYTLQKWKDGIEQKEQLDKLKLQSELDILKSQVNPHFLFNSLNSLSSLIGENPQQAELFVDELSKVYRYLLRNNEEVLTGLDNELNFIRSYAHLLKTRYGNSIEVIIDVPVSFYECQLPPLTLQLLVENAVKHNTVLKNDPLKIEIHTKENKWLVVKNNLKKKINRVDSSKVGLKNIREKYLLLNQPGIEVEETPSIFMVSVPLIRKNETPELINSPA
jgi:two-component system, LytTR family, sensor kinase